MQKNFYLNILTPGALVYKGDVSSLVVPAALGYLGVLADHAPLIANLKAGKIIVKESSGGLTIINNKGKGFLKVFKNKTVILLDSVD
ncbi:MAG: F0F1 ATP synthase subunit epsilon [Candidatus Omnitrophica bacterium]|nr:F0F1 ATP synthase subunit epsilon [Candidatus Omnitrophota bacterium]